jgi:Flp pilus assembly protein TadD
MQETGTAEADVRPPGRVVRLEDLLAQAAALAAAGEIGQAESLYLKLLQATHGQSPQAQAAVHGAFALFLIRQQRDAEAVEQLRQALVLNPVDAASTANLGFVLKRLRRFKARLVCCQRAALLDPGNGAIVMNLGSALMDLGQVKAALPVLQRANQIMPNHLAVLTNLANAWMRLGRLAEATRLYQALIRSAPDLAQISGGLDLINNLSICQLTAGDFAGGMQASAEWRRRRFDPPTAPLWRGQSFAGQTLLLYADQGLGDTIMFSRYAALAAMRGGTVILQVQAPLVALLRRLQGVSAIYAQGEVLPPVDWVLPLQMAMQALETTAQTIPWSGPYLKSPATEPRNSQTTAGGIPRVGIAWAGNSVMPLDHLRSIPLTKWQPLLERPVQLVSLQTGDSASALASLSGTHGFEDAGTGFDDFTATADCVASLDLVISVDSVAAHLAGAMGKPVWILISQAALDWRWQMQRPDSPWYPSARLFRLPVDTDWSVLMQEVAVALDSWLEQRATAA